MIIWINGAFGSGKTHTSYELARRIPNSYVYDPEEVGFFIRDNIPSKLKLSDFQDFPMWREFNYRMLEYISREHEGVIIIPMTITNKTYFDEIVGKLKREGIDIRHFSLLGSRETLLKRLKKRGDGKNSWPAQQIERCINSLSDDLFEEHITTDNMTIDEVVEYIAAACGIDLAPDNRSWMMRKIDGFKIWCRHIRLFR